MKTIAPTICSIHISELEPPEKKNRNYRAKKSGRDCSGRCARTFNSHVRHECEYRRVSTVAAIQSLRGETADTARQAQVAAVRRSGTTRPILAVPTRAGPVPDRNEGSEDAPVQHPLKAGCLLAQHNIPNTTVIVFPIIHLYRLSF